MSLQEKFDKAAADAKKLKSLPSNDDLLILYAYFKQGTVGDVNTDRPGLLDVKGKAKWDAWAAKKGLSKEEAQQKYIEKVAELIASIGLQ